MRVVNLSEQNSVLNQFLREIRDVNIQSDPLRFRRNIERIGEYMAIEVSKALNYQPTEVQTPLATTIVNKISDQLALVTVRRAGWALHQVLLNIIDSGWQAHMSDSRCV